MGPGKKIGNAAEARGFVGGGSGRVGTPPRSLHFHGEVPKMILGFDSAPKWVAPSPGVIKKSLLGYHQGPQVETWYALSVAVCGGQGQGAPLSPGGPGGGRGRGRNHLDPGAGVPAPALCPATAATPARGVALTRGLTREGTG